MSKLHYLDLLQNKPQQIEVMEFGLKHFLLSLVVPTLSHSSVLLLLPLLYSHDNRRLRGDFIKLYKILTSSSLLANSSVERCLTDD